MEIPEIEQNLKRKCFVFKIIAFESRVAYSHNPEQDTCHSQSICHETPLRFNISRREIFSKSVSCRVMKGYDKSSLIQISGVFGTL